MGRTFKEDGLALQPMITQQIAMVTGENDHGLIEDIASPEGVENRADFVIDLLYEPCIVGPIAPGVLCRELCQVDPDLPVICRQSPL